MNKEKLLDRPGFRLGAASVLCAAAGLFLGFLVLLIIEPKEAGIAMGTMLQNFAYFPRADVALEYFGTTLVQTCPLAICAFSVIYARKAGLFNIGVSGQFAAGACAALYLALKCGMPWWVCLPAGMLAGAVIGAASGAFKAYRNVNEVISGIMLNWIVLYPVNMILTEVADSNTYTLDISLYAPSALLPGLGLDRLFAGNDTVTIALPLTVLLAFGVNFVLKRTRLGFETRAVGFNPSAASLSGMDEKKNMVLTMAIAGALSGLAAGFCYLCGLESWQCSLTIVPAIGFDAIAAAFLGVLDPLGAFVASYFVSHIRAGSFHIDRTVYPEEIASLIVAITIYASAFAAYISSRLAPKAGGGVK